LCVITYISLKIYIFLTVIFGHADKSNANYKGSTFIFVKLTITTKHCAYVK